MGHNGKVLSNGLTYATPFPIIVFLGMKVVLPVFKVAETIPVCPGKILTLFSATIGMEIHCIKVYLWCSPAKLIDVPKMFCLSECHKAIPNHKLKLQSGLPDFPVLMVILSKNGTQLCHLLCGWVWYFWSLDIFCNTGCLL